MFSQRSVLFLTLLGFAGCANRVDWLSQDERQKGGGSGGANQDDGTGASKSMAAAGDSSAGAGPTSSTLAVPPTLIWPDDCEARWQYRCDNYDPLERCSCDVSLPADIEECGGYGALYCDHFFQGGYDVWVECECVAGAPAAPEDCSSPENFTCDHQQDGAPPEQCSCGP